MAFVSCGKFNAEVADLQTQIDALAGAATPDASETVKGKVELATLAEVASGASGALAVTPANLVSALNDAAGPNALQGAVTNAIEKSIAGDTGAQAAIANAIVEEVVAVLGFKDCDNTDIAVGAALATCQNLSDAIDAIPGDKFLQGLQSYDAATNTMTLAMSDGSTVSIDMTALVNDAVAGVGNATESAAGIAEIATAAEVAAGTDDTRIVTPLKLATALAAGATPDASEIVKGKVELATSAETIAGTDTTRAVTPAGVAAAIAAAAPSGAETKVTAGTNVTVSGTGTTADPYVVNASQQTAQQVATAIADDVTAQATLAGALVDDLPDTEKTVRGLVNLTDLQQMGDGRKVFDAGVHVGNGNPAFADRASVTAVGYYAGYNNTGIGQTATGRAAGQNNAGYYQTATGTTAGQNNTGTYQTATGYAAGRDNTGDYQTATGYAAGNNNTGTNNSFYGHASGTQIGALLGTVTMTPSSSTAGTVSPALPASVVGKSLPVAISAYDWRVLTFTSTTAYTTIDGPAYGTWTASVYEGLKWNNVTALGYGSEPTASNQVMLGNGAVTEVRTAGTYFGAGFTTVSDATLKENVEDIDPVKALAFRNGLKWKRFEVFSETQSEIMEEQTFEREETVTKEDGTLETKKVSVTVAVPTGAYKTLRTSQGVQYGLIAQDVQALAKKVGAFDDVVIVIGEYFDLDADGFPKKDAKGNVIKHKRLGINYDAINVIVMAGEQAALSK